MAKGELIKKMPPWAIGVLAVGGLVIVGLVGFKVYKKVKENAALKGAKEEADAVKKELAQQPAPTLTPAQMKIIANELFNAMDGYGTDVAAVYANIAKLKNNADVLGVIDAFGIKEISSGALNPTPNFKGTLPSALTVELNKDQINAINMVLAKKGIKYRF